MPTNLSEEEEMFGHQVGWKEVLGWTILVFFTGLVSALIVLLIREGVMYWIK